MAAFTMSMSAMGQNILAAARCYCSHATPVTPAAGNGVLVVTTHCEYLATIPADEHGDEHDTFAAMVHLKAPTVVGDEEARRTPLDLVAVLDVGESMAAGANSKLEQAKRAIALVVDGLGPRDRLSVVVNSSGEEEARRVVPLTPMSEDGKATARLAVESLAAATTSTNIRAGLDEADKVVKESRRSRNDRVAGIILLSDGSDLVKDGRLPSTPVHTFAFGSDHDAALHGISAATHGTFYFIDESNNLEDALAMCLGRLRSPVTAEDVFLEVEPWNPDLTITTVKSGVYDIIRSDDVTVSVGEMYADEERRFLFFLDVPRGNEVDGGVIALGDYVGTRLIHVRCSYTDMTEQQISVAPEDEYMEVLTSVEVERERHRVDAVEDVALAHAAAERGDYAEAGRILAARRETVVSKSASEALAAELDELRRRVADEREYRRTGRASFLASMSAHALQRGASVQLSRPLSAAGVQFGWAGSAMYGTPAMRKMEELWEMRRQQQKAAEAPAPADKGRSKVAAPAPARSRLEARLAAAAPRISMLRRFRRLVPRIKP